MTELVWVTTTTRHDGTFDIFQFTAWLQSATLLELYAELARIESLAIDSQEQYQITFGKARDEAADTAEYYNNVHHHISMEICDRTNASFKPPEPN